MGTTLNSRAYRQLIDEDIAEVMKYMPKSLERNHIIDVLEWSVVELYKDKNEQKRDGESRNL